ERAPGCARPKRRSAAPEGGASLMRCRARSAAGRPEDERVADVHEAAALRLGDLDRAAGAGHAVLDALVAHAAGRRALDHALRRDLELHDHGAGQVLLHHQLALVAVPDPRQLAADVAADDVLVEVAGGGGVADADLRRARLAAAHAAAAGAGAVARPGAGAVADEAVAAGADGAPAGAAAAGPDALQAVAPAARHLADLVADQAAVDVAVVDAGGEVSRTGQRGERPARGLLQEAEHTGLAGVLDRLLLGQLRRRVVVLHGVLAGLTGRLLLAHLALVERHLGAGAAGGLLVTGVHLLLFLLRVLL